MLAAHQHSDELADSQDDPQLNALGFFTTVLLADGRELLLEGLVALVTSMPGCRLLATARGGPEALYFARELAPQVILLDDDLPGLSGSQAIERLLDEAPKASVVVLARSTDDDAVRRALRAGARGYLAPDSTRAELRLAIEAAANGNAFLGHMVAARISRYFSVGRIADKAFPDLTDRELEVLDLVAQGLSNPEIAHHLAINSKTVRNHVSNLLSKLGVGDRREAAELARAAGMAFQAVES